MLLLLAASSLPRLLARLSGPVPPTAAAAGPSTRPVVAMLGIAGDTSWLRESAAERLVVELEAGDSILALSRDRSSEVLRETGTAIAEVAEQYIPRLGRALGAGFVIVGDLSMLERGSEQGVRLDLRLHDAGTGAVLAETTELGPEVELDAVVHRAALRLREALGAAAPTAEERRAALAKLPRSTAAERDYTLGLERLRAWDAATARGHFERAIAAEPGYALAHLRLAEAWQLLGFEGEARDATRRA